MPTNTPGTTARKLYTQQVHYLRKDITFADGGTTVIVGILPAGARIKKVTSGAGVDVAFNGGTTNTVSIGTAATPTLWGSALALGAIADVPLDEAVSMKVDVDTVVQAVVVSTPTPSAGQASIEIWYTI